MDFIFLRVNETTFHLIPTRTKSRSEDRILRRNLENLIANQLPKPMFDNWRKEVQNYKAATEIVRLAREYPTYKFWEFVDFSEQVFHYDQPDQVLKKIIGKNKDGMTMEQALTEIMSKLGWKADRTDQA